MARSAGGAARESQRRPARLRSRCRRALLLLNAQLDGFVALGLGAAIALWSQAVPGRALPGAHADQAPARAAARALPSCWHAQWRVLAGWAAAGFALLGVTMALNPRWVLEWLGRRGATVTPGSREVDLPHLGTLLPAPGCRPAPWRSLSLSRSPWCCVLATQAPPDFRAAAAVLVAGGVLVAPHALPTDLVLVARGHGDLGQGALARLAGAVGRRRDRALSARAVAPPSWGVLVVGWLCLRAAAGLSGWRPGPAPASADEPVDQAVADRLLGAEEVSRGRCRARPLERVARCAWR